VGVSIESKEIAEGLNGDDGAGDGIIFGNRLLEKDLQGFPGATAQIGKKLPIIEIISAEDFRDAEYKMPVRREKYSLLWSWGSVTMAGTSIAERSFSEMAGFYDSG
jgi:hypothetical protein